jgi:2-dehydro-3-deoxyphosphogluconate aldolase/(4S)-4-hydroxy-2-oxoglutarate aldolase
MSIDRAAHFIRSAHRQGFLPIVRSETPSDAISTGLALQEAGVSVLELTRSTPGVESAVRELAAAGLCIGVGTIKHPDEISQAAAAGAQFVVSYYLPDGFVDRALTDKLVPIPGVQTLNEMQAAHRQGARILKIFPAWQSHPRIIADVRPLIPGIQFIPTGGTDGQTASDWLDAGALAFGVGRALGTSASVGAAEVTKRARLYVERFSDKRGIDHAIVD